MSGQRTRLILWRHGQTDWNAQSRFQGQSDVPLNETGRAQASQAAAVLAELPVAAIYASTLSRAQVTAGVLAELVELPVRLDARLREIDVGSWEGLTLDSVRADNPEFAAAMAAGRDFRRSPEGETSVETGVRVGQALRDIAANHAGETVVVTGHGLAIRMATAELLGWDHSAAVQLGGMQNCGWTTLETKPGQGWRLITWNQLAHGAG